MLGTSTVMCCLRLELTAKREPVRSAKQPGQGGEAFFVGEARCKACHGLVRCAFVRRR